MLDKQMGPLKNSLCNLESDPKPFSGLPCLDLSLSMQPDLQTLLQPQILPFFCFAKSGELNCFFPQGLPSFPFFG
jgi:hypothetical protein